MRAALRTRPEPTRTASQEIRSLRRQLAVALRDRDRLADMLRELLAISMPDPREDQLRRLEHAETWAAGYAEGERAGFARAVREYKRAQRGAIADLELHLRRWDGPRERFADPRPADFPGREAAS
jgi:hypothetical protein